MAIKKIFKELFAMPAAGVITIMLAFAMAVATFIESSSGTIAAKALVYNSWWFEMLIVIIFISILLNIIRFKLYTLKRLPIFLFHFSFLVIILGAGITRYISSEGTIRIREGSSSDVYQSYDTYFYASTGEGGDLHETRQKVFLSSRSGGQIGARLRSPGQTIRFKSTEFISGSQMAAQMGGMARNNPEDVVKVRVRVNGVSEEILLRGRVQQPLRLSDFEIGGVLFKAGFGSMASQLPFSIELVDFQLERYPGSNSPSSYASEVILHDPSMNIEQPYRIFMNNILKHRGYRFYQSSYDPDEKGTVLSVNNDALGTTVTYIGYFLMIVTMLISLLAPGSRFVRLVKHTRKPMVAALAFFFLAGLGTIPAMSQENKPVTQNQEAAEFGRVWVQGVDGRFKPVNTLAQEITRKLFEANTYGKMTPEQLWLDMMANSLVWEQKPIFDIDNPQIAMMLGTQKTRLSFGEFFRNNQYILGGAVNEAVNKAANQRSGLEKELLDLDEKLNIFYLAYTGQMLRIFPIPGHPESKWVDVNTNGAGFPEQDSAFVTTSFRYYLDAVSSGQLAEAAAVREGIALYQNKYSESVLPSESKARLEVLYNKFLFFERLTIFYAVIGLIMLVIQFMAMFKKAKWHRPVNRVFSVLLIAAFVIHTVALGIRWYVSGHAPMSNGYESMIFVAWGTILAGVLLIRRSKMAVALTAVLAAVALLVAHLSWMSPEITPLVPVLKSPWLTIHVAVIMTSYSFLGLGALVGLVNIILYILKTRRNASLVDQHIDFLTKINQIVIIVGLYLITIGCFLGAVWANVSWGRYWGWDPKETWALISILVYTFITHMHYIKGMDDNLSYNLASVLGFGSIIMTYFGVNYFLGGMHSYAGGATPVVPMGLYVAIIILIILIYTAYFNQQKFQTKAVKNKN